MSELGQKQEKFMRLLPRLLDHIHSQGFGTRGGELQRPEEMAKIYEAQGKGISQSLHRLKLAIDLTLTKNGIPMIDSADYAFAGEYWKSLDPECCWGGDFKDKEGKPKPDGDHFSITYQGVK